MLNQKTIENEIEELSEMKVMIEKQLLQLQGNVPKGSFLRAAMHGNDIQFYYRKDGKDKCGKYIKKNDLNVAACLAQIEYNQKLLNAIDREISELMKIHSIPQENLCSSVLEKINPLKRKLIKIPYISDEEYCLEWIKQDYTTIGFKENTPEYYTKKGLRVRSKSEIIIAEALDRYEVPYLYEKPLMLGSGRIVHPDFTILRVRDRKELYWEHFGMMDDMEYRNNAFMKIREYEHNGYYQGVNFIWTMETGKYPLNSKTVDCMARKLR